MNEEYLEYLPNRKRNKAGKRAPCGFEAWDERRQKPEECSEEDE